MSHTPIPATTSMVRKKPAGARIIAPPRADLSILSFSVKPLSKRMMIRVTVVNMGPTAPKSSVEARLNTGPTQIPMAISSSTSGMRVLLKMPVNRWDRKTRIPTKAIIWATLVRSIWFASLRIRFSLWLHYAIPDRLLQAAGVCKVRDKLVPCSRKLTTDSLNRLVLRNPGNKPLSVFPANSYLSARLSFPHANPVARASYPRSPFPSLPPPVIILSPPKADVKIR